MRVPARGYGAGHHLHRALDGAPSPTESKELSTNGSLLTTVAGTGAAAAQHRPHQAAAAAGVAGPPATTPATSARARPAGSASRAPDAAPPARPPPRPARARCWLVVSPPAPAEAGRASGCIADTGR